MAEKWYPSTFKGIRFKNHQTRKHGIKLDRYLKGSFRVNQKLYTTVFGWLSEGWTESEAFQKLCEYKKNAKTGEGPTSLKEEAVIFQAEQARIEKEKQVEEDPSSPQNITFETFYKEKYRSWAFDEKKNSTASGEDTYFKNYLLPVLGHKKLIEIKRHDLLMLKDLILKEKKLSGSTAEQAFNIFKSFWKCATLEKIIDKKCPTVNIKLPKIENERNRFFTFEEYTLLLEALEKRSQDVHDMVMLSVQTGARRGEIFDLVVSAVNLEHGFCVFRDGKGKTRHVYLLQESYEMLKRRAENKKPFERFFTNRSGGRYSDMPRTFERTVKALGFNKGVADDRDKIVFHTCRHTFASWHVQNGTDLYVVSKMLGHYSVTITEKYYAHLKPDGFKMAALKFDRLFEDEKAKLNID